MGFSLYSGLQWHCGGPFAGALAVEDKEIGGSVGELLGRVFDVCVGRKSKVEGIMVHILESPIKTVVCPTIHDSEGP